MPLISALYGYELARAPWAVPDDRAGVFGVGVRRRNGVRKSCSNRAVRGGVVVYQGMAVRCTGDRDGTVEFVAASMYQERGSFSPRWARGDCAAAS